MRIVFFAFAHAAVAAALPLQESQVSYSEDGKVALLLTVPPPEGREWHSGPSVGEDSNQPRSLSEKTEWRRYCKANMLI